MHVSLCQCFFFPEKTKLVTSSAMQLNAYLYQKHFVFPELTALAVVCLFRQEEIAATISNREKEKTFRSAPQNNRSWSLRLRFQEASAEDFTHSILLPDNFYNKFMRTVNTWCRASASCLSAAACIVTFMRSAWAASNSLVSLSWDKTRKQYTGADQAGSWKGTGEWRERITMSLAWWAT